jgi:uncharacterized protein DUF3987
VEEGSFTMVASRALEDVVRLILNDLLSEAPTYAYNPAEAGPYREHLHLLLEVRKGSGGLTAAKRTLDSLTIRDPLFAGLYREPISTVNRARVESDIPPLKEEALLPTGLLAQVSRFLSTYLAYSRRASPEGYEDFHLGCGLWVLSTVAARRIVVPLATPIYTALSIALVARTSLFAKTVTASAAVRVLKEASLGFLLGDDETTPQKLLVDMAGELPAHYSDLDAVQQATLRLRLAMAGQRGWYYDEFNQLINAMTRSGPMAEFAGLLRKLDGCPDEYKYSTRTHGQLVIEKPYLALLASTTPANLSRYAEHGGEFWHDGFWARFAFLTPPPHAWKTQTMELGAIPVPSALTEPLRAWHERLGIPECAITAVQDEHGTATGRSQLERGTLPETPVQMDEDAYQAFHQYRLALRQIVAESRTQDLDGSYVRLSDKALRIAALIGSLEHHNRISLSVWAVAQEIAEILRRNLHELYAQINTVQEEHPLEDRLIEHLKQLQGKSTTVREILRTGPAELRRLKADQVRNELTNLIRSGIVERDHVEGSRAEWYKLVS